MEQGFIDIIHKMVNDQGKGVLLETRKAKAIVGDYTQNQYKKETNLLKQLLDADCAKIINEVDNVAKVKTALVNRLEEEQGLSPKVTAELLDLLGSVIRGDKSKTVILGITEQVQTKLASSNEQSELNRITVGQKTSPINVQSTTVKVELKIPYIYDYVGWFFEGLAAVCLNDKWGFIDKTGKEVFPCIYSSVGYFSEGLAPVSLDGNKWGFIDKTGKEVFQCNFDYNIGHNRANSFSEGLALLCSGYDGNLWGGYKKFKFVDKTGEKIIPKTLRKFDYISVRDKFLDGVTTVCIGGDDRKVKCGFINKSGKEIIPCIYDWVDNFSEGLATVSLNHKKGFIDKNGKQVIPIVYDDVSHGFSEGMAAVSLNNKRKFIDKTGKEIIPCNYDWANNFSEGLAPVRLNDKWGFIDKTGKEVIPCIYRFVGDFSEGLASVSLDDNKWGFIDKTGIEIAPCIYNEYSDNYAPKFVEGMAVVLLNGKYGFLGKVG